MSVVPMTVTEAASATPPRPMNVYECIAAVSAEIAKTGIAKTRKNQQQGYKFRGVDDVYNALAPMLAKNLLVILPRILTRIVVEKTTQKGGVLFYVTVEAEFDFVSASDGSKHTVRTFGEAMDSADKATNKAMSAAYKYAAFQTFCIPTEGDNDADATTPDPIVPPLVAEKAPDRPEPPSGYVYVDRVTIERKGKFEWADVLLSTGEPVLAKGQQLVALLEQVAQEQVPVALTTSQTSKGYTQIDTVERWKPEPTSSDPILDEVSSAPF